MTYIHPTAIVEDGAEIGQDASIGPYCIVGSQVKLGAGVKLIAHVWVGGDTTIRHNTESSPIAVIGQDPKHKKCQ